ncbi:hypothetical protein BCR41DRAFT_220961 [Lobosporangium transversale]|uniref:Uncharacterized protein n=1 Tax=Lobosporangium transversale TaxID=64571 RepID=A0A1Y2GVR0_9FUNG|nr:hypothetical protein BCR41DRAFT_220961 [Lobosporangium transversale]ORZ26347.1 hypothetical protein BCR41DRAFT_220961 [Lobosporangium transversale]|eukprot:XP_021884112.1 hypothetical protein BCR41DRAFT_220961 [Lobosporangium transversale]
MVSILTQLAETNRSMANHLQTLSNQYGQSLAQPSERLHLQRVSLRAARAMYRLASVQNTVFPMLANATFVGNAPGAVTYRFQPASRMNTILREPQGSSNNNGSAGTRPSAPQRGSLSNFPFSILSRGAAGGRPAPLGLIPSIMAHARASAQNVNAALSSTINTATRPENASTPASASSSNSTAATAQPLGTSTSATPSSGTSSQLGARPIGRMIFGPNDSLSYTIQSPTRSSRRTNTNVPAPYAAAAAAATSPFASHFTRLMIPVVDQSSGGFVEFMRNLNSSFDNMEPSNSSQRTSEPTLAATVADFEANLAASRAINDATEQLERTLNSRASSRRRERPDDFSDINDGRATSRRRLTSQQPSFTDYENRVRQELEQLNSLIPGSSSSLPAASSAQGPASRSTTTTATTVPSPVSPQPQATVRPAVARTSSNEARRSQADSPSTASSPSPSSPSLPSPSATTSNNNSSNGSPAYNLGRIGVFISAILRMVDQPREDGSPRRLADVICNDPESPSTPLQDLVRNVAESVTVRETRSIVEGHPAPLRNIHPVLNSFIRERALNGQQLTESNLDSVAVMFAHAIMDAVHVDEILETLSPPASIQITSEDIRRISLDVLREHFRRLIYLVVAAPTGRESNWPTFARDVVLWIRDVVGSWRVAFYGLFPERDQAEAQRIATHVVGSAIHANGRRWVELSNRATNTLVNVLCANIVPRRREEQGGLVGGAWPLMATADRQNTSRPRGCTAAHSLLGSTAPPAPLGPTITAGHSTALEAETLSENLTRRITQMMAPLGLNISGIESLTARSIRDAVRAELSATRSSSFIGSSTSSSTTLAPANTNDAGSGNTTISASSARANNTDPEFNMQKEGETRQNNRKTRVEEVEDEDMS